MPRGSSSSRQYLKSPHVPMLSCMCMLFLAVYMLGGDKPAAPLDNAAASQLPPSSGHQDPLLSEEPSDRSAVRVQTAESSSTLQIFLAFMVIFCGLIPLVMNVISG